MAKLSKEKEPKAPILDTDGDAFERARLANEVQSLLKENEQRRAELAIIRSVQQGLSARLDMQAIYDLVGDTIRDLFNAQSLIIQIFDPVTRTRQVKYSFEEGQRYYFSTLLPYNRLAEYLITAKQPLVINQDAESRSAEFELIITPGTKIMKSGIFVPLLVGKDVRGFISLQNVERENAFSESDVNLLSTFASSMSAALENAFLFDETQRLLKETEQRNAELGIINSVQEGLASKLDMHGIYDLVGDKIREIFHAQGTAVYIFDHETEKLETPYCFLKQRYEIEARPFVEHPIASLMVRAAQPIMYRTLEEYRALGGAVLENSEEYKSGMYAPLMVGKELKGMLGVANLDKEYAYGESDLRLLGTLADSMSVALENARLFDETQRLLRETEQRNAELAIINSVQEGLASKLEFQSIIDLVGDQVHAITHAKSVSIALFDKTSEMVTWPYWWTLNKRIEIDPSRMGKNITRQVMYASKPLNLGTEQEILAHDAIPPQDGWTVGKSFLGVPFTVGDSMLGALCLHDFDKEYAFDEADERLLQTLANSMSVALENARLFDETEQRNAELAIINSVQEGLAAKLDIESIYELVGNKIHEIFHNADTEIRVYDPRTNLIHFPYFIDDGKRIAVNALPLTDSGVSSYILRTGQTLVLNENLWQEAAKFGGTPILSEEGHPAKSAVFVPLLVNHQARGLIVLGDVEREHAFSEADVRLLQTLANSMSTALENARLFDETQRLLKETEQRAAELAIISSLQQGLASNLEMQAIYELLGDQMREIFDAQSLLIVTFDHAREMAQVTYHREKEVHYSAEPYPFSGLHRYIIESRNSVVINENAREWQAKYGMVVLPGTEPAKSMIYVPLTSGYRVSGMISLQNLEREHAFSDMDVRLLETLAGYISVALENASLFDETQRLFVEAKEARAAAEQANQAKSAFLSSMSHELRTPLNAIINFVEMIARGMIGPVNREQVELLDQALQSSKHLLNLINDVLDISKIQAGQLTLFVEDDVSIQAEVDATLSIVGGLIQEKGLRLVRDIDPHLPMVACDRRRLRQVLLNLVSNAIKFTKEGTVTLGVKHHGRQLVFAVIDTGPGIPPDKRDLIFEPFVQAETGERQLQGTGLGLPISRSLIRAHGGELWVDSDGEGSAFFFTLPVNRNGTP